jgi:hypothetical protein
MEAEYISLYTAAKQAAWVRQIFGAIGHPYNQSIDIYCDSQAAIKVANQEGTHEAKKHIDVKYHYIQEQVANEKISIEYIESEDNEADIMTKCLVGKEFGKKTQTY